MADGSRDAEFEPCKGFLVNENHAVQDADYGVIGIIKVKLTIVDVVYITDSELVEIGHVKEGEDDRKAIERTLRYMKDTTLFDYIIKAHDYREPC